MLEQYVAESVPYDPEKAGQNLKTNDFSEQEYAEIDGRGADR